MNTQCGKLNHAYTLLICYSLLYCPYFDLYKLLSMTTLDIILVAAVIVTTIIVWLIQRFVTVRRLAVTRERLQQHLLMTAQLQQLNKTLQTEKENLLQQVAIGQTQLQFLNEQYELLKRYQRENEILNGQLSMFKAKFQAAEDRLENQKKEIEQIGEYFKSEFKNFAQVILGEKTEKVICS